MILPLLILGVTLRVGEAKDVEPELVAALEGQLAAALEARLGSKPVIDPVRAPCEAVSPCSERTLLIRVLGSLRHAVVIAERIDDQEPAGRREVQIPLSAGAISELAEVARNLVADLFPEKAPSPSPIAVGPAPQPKAERARWLPWSLAVTSLAAGGTGAALAWRASAIDAELAHGIFGREFLDRDKARADLSVAAAVSIAVSLAAVGLGVYLGL